MPNSDFILKRLSKSIVNIGVIGCRKEKSLEWLEVLTTLTILTESEYSLGFTLKARNAGNVNASKQTR